MGTSGKKGTEVWNLETGANPEHQGCQWLLPEQQNVKAVSVWHCAATTTPLSCCPNCYAELSHKDNVCSSAVGKQMKQKKSNSLAEHHLLLLISSESFFVRVQLTSLLLISPGLCCINNMNDTFLCSWVTTHSSSPLGSLCPEVTPCGWQDIKTQLLLLPGSLC